MNQLGERIKDLEKDEIPDLEEEIKDIQEDINEYNPNSASAVENLINKDRALLEQKNKELVIAQKEIRKVELGEKVDKNAQEAQRLKKEIEKAYADNDIDRATRLTSQLRKLENERDLTQNQVEKVN